eukprot:102889_1
MALLHLVHGLWFFHVSLSQSHVCLWGVYTTNNPTNVFQISAMNGLYTQSQAEHNEYPYYTKPNESCHPLYYMYYVGSPINDWQVYTWLDETWDFAHCTPSIPSDITSCSEWKIWDFTNHITDPNTFTRLNACPSWRCDQVSIPSLPNACNTTFDEYLGNNTWRNSLHDLYWYFNPLYFRWECHNTYPDPCNDSPLAYTDSGWTDLHNSSIDLYFRVPDINAHTVQCIVIPPTATPSISPTDLPSTSPTVSPTAATHEYHSPTVLNVTMIVNDSISINDVIDSVNNTIFTYLIAHDIPTPLQTDIIRYGTTITAIYGFPDDLDVDVMNAKEIERQISKELEETHPDTKIKVGIISNGHTDEKTDTRNDGTVWMIIGIVAFVVCVIVIVCDWFKCKQRNQSTPPLNEIEIMEAAPLEPHDMGGEAGERGSVLVQKDDEESSDSDGDHDNLYVENPAQRTAIGGKEKEDNEADEDTDEELDKMYGKAHKTVKTPASKDGVVEDIIEGEGGEDSAEDADDDRADAIYEKPEKQQKTKGKMNIMN